MLQWTGKLQETHITMKELAPIVIAAIVWGQEWRGQAVLFKCDNMAVLSIIDSGSSRNPQAMQLSRCLAFLAVKRDLTMRASHTYRWLAPETLRLMPCHGMIVIGSFLLSPTGRPSGQSNPTNRAGHHPPDWSAKGWTEQSIQEEYMPAKKHYISF